MKKSLPFLTIGFFALVLIGMFQGMTEATTQAQVTAQANTNAPQLYTNGITTYCNGVLVTYAPNPLRGYKTCVMQAVGNGPYKASTYKAIAYTPDMCLLPSADESYLEPSTPNAPIICINTGKIATPQDIQALIFADNCTNGGYVPCVPTCTSALGYPIPCQDTQYNPINTSLAPSQPCQDTTGINSITCPQDTSNNTASDSHARAQGVAYGTSSATIGNNAPATAKTVHHTTRKRTTHKRKATTRKARKKKTLP